MNSIAHSDLIINFLVSLVMLLVTLTWGQPQYRFNASIKAPAALTTPRSAVAGTDSILVTWHSGFKVIEVTR